MNSFPMSTPGSDDELDAVPLLDRPLEEAVLDPADALLATDPDEDGEPLPCVALEDTEVPWDEAAVAEEEPGMDALLDESSLRAVLGSAEVPRDELRPKLADAKVDPEPDALLERAWLCAKLEPMEDAVVESSSS